MTAIILAIFCCASVCGAVIFCRFRRKGTLAAIALQQAHRRQIEPARRRYDIAEAAYLKARYVTLLAILVSMSLSLALDLYLPLLVPASCLIVVLVQEFMASRGEQTR